MKRLNQCISSEHERNFCNNSFLVKAVLQKHLKLILLVLLITSFHRKVLFSPETCFSQKFEQVVPNFATTNTFWHTFDGFVHNAKPFAKHVWAKNFDSNYFTKPKFSQTCLAPKQFSHPPVSICQRR